MLPIPTAFPPVACVNHCKVPAPLALNVVVCPLQIVNADAAVVLLGPAGATLTMLE